MWVCVWNSIILGWSIGHILGHVRRLSPHVTAVSVLAVIVDSVDGCIGSWARVLENLEH